MLSRFRAKETRLIFMNGAALTRSNVTQGTAIVSIALVFVTVEVSSRLLFHSKELKQTKQTRF